jgi:hypothetical protein
MVHLNRARGVLNYTLHESMESYWDDSIQVTDSFQFPKGDGYAPVPILHQKRRIESPWH